MTIVRGPSGNWNTNSTWQRFDGTTWVNVNGVSPNTVPTSSDGVITILNTHTITVSANTAADQVTVDAGGQITVSSGKTLTVVNGAGTDLIVNGAVNNDGTITTTGTVSFGANSTYTHTRNGGTIPTATWNATSNCIITGATGNAPGGLGQSFGNFTWNSTGQTSTINLNGALTTINGTFTLASTGAGGDLLRLTNGTDLTMNIGGDFISTNGDMVFTNNNNTDVTLNITGNFSQSGGSIDFSSSTYVGILAINITGNFSQSGGSIDFVSGGASVTQTPSLSVAGNFSQTGAGTITTSTSDADIVNGTIIFNKNGLQTFSISTQSNTTYTNFTVAANSILKLNSSVTLSSISTNSWAGNFTVSSNGALDAGLPIVEFIRCRCRH